MKWQSLFVRPKDFRAYLGTSYRMPIRTLRQTQTSPGDGQVMEGDDGLRRRASVIVLGGP